MAKTIIVNIPLVGLSEGKRQVQTETSGFQGTGCRDVTKQLEAALGSTVADTEKAEMYEAPTGQIEFLQDGSGGGQ